MQVETGDKVMVTEGSSEGHMGTVQAVKWEGGAIRIFREDGMLVDVPEGSYTVIEGFGIKKA